MKYKSIIIILGLWIMVVFLDYYQFPYFIRPIIWLLVTIRLISYTLKQAKKLVRNRDKPIIVTFSISVTLLFLTIYRFYGIPHFIIENLDWKIQKGEREKIVGEVINGKLKPNSEFNPQLCTLNNTYSYVSNDGNDIIIYNYKGKTTVKFWISRGFFNAPQSYFIYSNNQEDIEFYEKLTVKEPEHNWKIEPNWYRILERQ